MNIYQWMDAYLDGELSDIQKIEFELHLKECDTCQEIGKTVMLKQALSSFSQLRKKGLQFLAEILQILHPDQKSFPSKKSLVSYPGSIDFLFGALQIFGWVTGLISFHTRS